MNLGLVFATFGVVFLGELPDKTMFASLLMASRGRPLAVWAGAAVAFAVHVAIAVTVGVVLFHLVPHRPLEGLVAAAFLAAAVWSFLIRNRSDEEPRSARDGSGWRVAATAAGVIFVAEWGDLTQVLTANLAARYHSPLTVGVGALAALLVVAAIAVTAGGRALRLVSVHTLRVGTAAVLLGLAAYTGYLAIWG